MKEKGKEKMLSPDDIKFRIHKDEVVLKINDYFKIWFHIGELRGKILAYKLKRNSIWIRCRKRLMRDV